MSNRYKGGIISATPPTTNGPFQDGAASGAWTLEQQMQANAAGTWPLAGNVGPDAFIENLFQTWLYTGNGSTQTITNGIDLAGEGGLVWVKNRSAGNGHALVDTARGNSSVLSTSSASAQTISSNRVSGFLSTGFSVGNDTEVNGSGSNYASWTFREQPKFFDVVTFTSSASGNKTFNHNLGAVPGCVIIKNTQTSDPWIVYHRSVGDNAYLQLNSTAAQDPLPGAFSATSTTFTISSSLMYNSQTYVAYLFAHNAGGFGLTGTDNVISCGSYVGNGATAGPQVTLGYEPQWVLRKNVTAARGGPGTAGSWSLVDNMRGMSQTTCPFLFANSSAAEDTSTVTTGYIIPNATGFVDTYTYPDDTYIYIAIRRGPMAVPTTGTSVFSPVARAGTGADVTVSSGFPTDSALTYNRGGTNPIIASRLTSTGYLATPSTAAEDVGGTTVYQANPWDVMSGIKLGTTSALTNQSGNTFINYMFRRAPGFFDVVCYTGTGVAGQTFAHNLTVAPEMMIVKKRSSLGSWYMYVSSLGATKYMQLNDNDVAQTSTQWWNDTEPTSTVFSLGDQGAVNGSGDTFVAYLFATVSGVSKTGSYTGTGTTQTIDCGFTSGARFVLIKRTDTKITTEPTTGWYVWDSARGIVAGNDPYFLLNSFAAEVTNTDYVDTAATGFEISSTAPDAINASGGTFIFLAIA